jgi:hypothetical protein
MTRLLNQKKDLCQGRDSDRSTNGIVSPWKNPIPLEEHQMSPVVVYLYSNRWIPMKCFSLAEAIALYRKALSLGKKIIVYPPSYDPYIHRSAIPPCETGVE